MNISRRTLLRHAAAWSVASPVLRALSASGAPGDAAKRVVIIFSPNGPQHQKGPCEGTELDFQLHPWWSPLERHRSDGVFFRSAHQAGQPFFEVKGEYGHLSGGVGALTATASEGTRAATGPSIDQFIARRLQEKGVVTPQRSLLFGLYDRARNPWYEAAGQAIAPIFNPWTALEAMAPALDAGPESVAQTALRKKHFIMDQLGQDCRRLRQDLDGEGRALLDFHCSSLESLEQSVAASLVPRNECALPSEDIAALPADANWLSRETRDAAMGAFVELTALAFACDLTRVVGVGFGNAASRFAIPEKYGVPSSGRVDSGDSGPQMHAWTHQSRNNPDTLRAMEIFYHWFSSQVAALIDALKRTPDADGRPLFESTLVLWTSEFGSGGPHSNANVPVMLFGGGDAIRTGRMLEAEGDKEAKALVLHQLFVSVCRYMGLSDVDTFGNAGRGPLEWLAG